MWELWENPARDRTVSAERDPRFKELQRYMDSSFLNVMLHPPPFGAMTRFEGVSVEQYHQHCLDVATTAVDNIIKELT